MLQLVSCGQDLLCGIFLASSLKAHWFLVVLECGFSLRKCIHGLVRTANMGQYDQEHWCFTQKLSAEILLEVWNFYICSKVLNDSFPVRIWYRASMFHLFKMLKFGGLYKIFENVDLFEILEITDLLNWCFVDFWIFQVPFVKVPIIIIDRNWLWVQKNCIPFACNYPNSWFQNNCKPSNISVDLIELF